MGDAIADDIVQRGLSPKLVHGHKLSMEAIVAHKVAQRLGIPFGVSLQGNTDRRILSVRPDLHGLYQDIYHGAAIIFPFAPWIKDFADAHLGAANGHIAMLPCMTMNDNMLPPQPSAPAGNKAITAFHLRHWHLKNADRLIAAAGKLGVQRAGFRLDIAGGGEAVHHDRMSQIIAAEAPDNVNLIGPVAGADIQQWMNTASLFVMPSRRETFGLVFVEALMAGCPIIYPKNAAVDGYFDGYNFARAVDASDENAIANIMAEMLDAEAKLKEELALWQQSEHAKQFHRANITDIFVKGLNMAIAKEG
jgi:glycosyltransferase involved in cell wall biosynthesis